LASKIFKKLFKGKDRKIVEVKKVKCRSYSWEGVDVEIIIYDDGVTQVKCPIDCGRCGYRNMRARRRS